MNAEHSSPANVTEVLHDTYDYLCGQRHNVWAVMLYGSQNYKLNTPESDVDTKAMTLPTFRDVALHSKQFSTEYSVAGGLCTAKDFRLMFDNFLKSNLNFLECLYTNHVLVCNEYHLFDVLVKNRDLVANSHPYRLLHSAAGMASQKYHAFKKPFESKQAVLAKYGYDPKQLHHLCRLELFMRTYLKTNSFAASLVPRASDRRYLLNLKTDPMPLKSAEPLAERTMVAVNALLEDLPYPVTPYPDARNFLDDLTVEVLASRSLEELLA